ncbi:MAG: HpcH/HpaI aldolase/citrate lyase family protein [Solirubrobacteraceae bacterium]
MPEPPPIRSYLYAPGSRPELMEKALGSGADAVIFDLEDGVTEADKPAARNHVAALLAQPGRSAGPMLHVRINRGADGPDLDDLAAVALPGLSGVRLPKVAGAGELESVAAALDRLESTAGIAPGTVLLYPTVETAAAALAAGELAGAPRVARLVFGATDFLADIGSPGAADGPATALARGQLVLASRAAGIGAPVDSVHTKLDDEQGLRQSAERARELGFFGKSVIHPRQLAIVHTVFTPGDEELAQARRVVAHTASHGGGASALGDEMVDAAVLARARRLLAIAAEQRQP